ncbi:MAG: metal ABC transporter permease [Promethearchaeota archaeon]
MANLQDFITSLQYSYMQRAIMSTLIVGIVCGLIGVFIILKGMSFLGAGIAHSCFAGGALAILLGVDPFFTILLFGESTAMIIGFINERDSSSSSDTAVGIMFSLTMALAVLFVGLNKEYSTNIQSLLFGNALLITVENLNQLIVISVIVIVIFFLFRKEFLFIIFDESMAKISGIPVKFLNYLFLALIGAIITISLRAIGAILVFAMIVTPAAAAYQWTFKVNIMLFLSSLFGAISAFLGMVFAFIFDLPTGSTIVLIVTFIFGVSFTFSPKRRSHKYITAKDQVSHTKECRYCNELQDEQDCPYCEEQLDHLHPLEVTPPEVNKPSGPSPLDTHGGDMQ